MALETKRLIQGAKNNFLFFAEKMGLRSKKQSIVVNHVTVRPVERKTQDIQKWRNALTAAEMDYQQRTLLYDLYADVLLDARLKSLLAQRTAKVTNAKISFSSKGKPVEAVNQLTKMEYFNKFAEHSLASRYWGHSLLELNWPMPGDGADKGQTLLVPRKHVKPRKGIVTKSSYDIEGLPYREKPYADFCIEIGDPDDLGIILEACPMVIYKRGGFGDWAEFAEVFGMPFRWATYNSEQSRGILEKALAEAGAAGYVVAPQDANLQFHNPTAGSQSNDIFRFLIDQCNQELAVLVLGNTMTTQEAKHSGYAQSETHRQTQDEIHADDRKFILRCLNEKLTPYLEALGYPVKGGEWHFDEGDGLTLAQRLDIDIKLSEKIAIGPDYWYEKYMVPKPKPGEIVEDDDEEEGDETDEGSKVKGQKSKKA